MKSAVLLAAVLFTSGSFGYLIKVPDILTPTKIGSEGWTHLQKVILQLFDNICEDSTDPMIIRNAEEFTFDASSIVYSKPEVIENLRVLKTGKGLLPKGEIFTEYNKDHYNELKVVYDVLYYAKDFSTFLKAAAWTRQNVNCGLFFDAVYLAILTRRDTEVLSVPAPYEILPNYFITRDIIIKASTILSGEQITPSDSVQVVGNSYVLDANYTVDIYENNYESKLAYFHEDVGLNSYYFLQKLKRAPWFNVSPDMSDRYGEYLYHMMKQLAIRYDLERYSNGLPEIDGIDWTSFATAPYDPMLVYSNGNEFGQRRTVLDSLEATNLELLQNVEANIATVVEHMISTGYNKTQILNHVMEILVTGDNSYETVARALIGKDSTLEGSLPSVMDHYITSLRDPVFWKVNKQIVNIVDLALKKIPSYSRNELYFPGIEVVNVVVKKMSTAFEDFDIDVTDALKTSSADTTFQVKIKQPRLNHKPFTLKLNITSLVTEKGVVKIYLGPKVAPGELATKRNQFMLLDSFEANFKIGANVISRSSDEMKDIGKDLPSYRALLKKVQDAEFGIDSMSFLSGESKTGFPSRLILPKGSPEGVPLQIFVFVAPFVKSGAGAIDLLPSLDFNSAILSPGFPLDLNIDDTLLYSLPNAILTDVVITHKDGKKSSYDASTGSAKWQGGGDYGGRPDFTKKEFDYASKKVQYAKESDHETTKTNYDKDVEYKVENEKTDVIPNPKDDTEGKVHLLRSSLSDASASGSKWQRGDEYSGRPDFTKRDFDHTSRKEQYAKKRDFTRKDFDYTSRKEQYAKKTDYETKKTDDYSKDFDYKVKNKKTDEASNVVDKTAGKVDVTEDMDQYISVTDNIMHPDINDVMPETVRVTRPFYDVPSYNRTPSVYDYLFNRNNNIDYTDYKVYE